MRDLLNIPFLLILIAVAAAIGFVVLSFVRSTTPVENALFQILIAVTGLFGSYIFGRNSAMAAAHDVIRPHARAAFRRVTTLYNSLHRLSARIEELKQEQPDYRLDLIQVLVNEQIEAGRDAIEDWREIIPEDVEEIERRSARNG